MDLNRRPQLWPVAGRLLSFFGQRTDPFSGEGRFHTGLDISAGTGTPVRATADGMVAHAGWSSGYGKLVVVKHPEGHETYYAHLSRFNVVAGQEVRMGEVVAYSGATGRAQSPHLHYEVRHHGTPLNPYKFLQRVALEQNAQRRDLPF
jgi:murein DD-endopeptidase MepM/ murein hydrolase activator NlpD